MSQLGSSGLGDFPGILGQCGPLGQLSQVGALGDLRNKTAAEQQAHAAQTMRRLSWAFDSQHGSCNISPTQRFTFDDRWPRYDVRDHLKFNPPLGGEHLPYTGPRNKKPSRFRRLASWLRSKCPPAFWLRWKQNRLWKRRQREYDEQLVNAIVSGLTAR